MRVMLNPARRSGEPENEASRKTLEQPGVEVIDSNPAFDLTHEKSMVVDDETALRACRSTGRPENLTETRDYAVVTAHRHEVRRGRRVLRRRLAPQAVRARREGAPDLVQPQRPRPHRASSSTSAKHTLFLQNERYQDEVIIERLVRAAAPRREGARPGAPAAHAEEGASSIEGVDGTAHPATTSASRCTSSRASSCTPR